MRPGPLVFCLAVVALGCGEEAAPVAAPPPARPSRLDFSGQEIGPSQLERVHPAVTSLGFRSARFGDDQLAALGALPELASLDLGYTQITPAGLQRLTQYPKLQTLHLVGLSVDDAGLAPILELEALRGLNLGETQITDAGLAKLPALAQIEWLELGATKISSAGLAELARLPKLKRLLLSGVDAKDEDVERLTKALPGLDVQR